MKRNGKSSSAEAWMQEIAAAPAVLPSIAPVWLTREERAVLVKALWTASTPKDGYKDFVSAVRKIKGE